MTIQHIKFKFEVADNNVKILLESESDFLQYLEEDFCIQTISPLQYINCYKKNGFINSNQSLVTWDSGLFLYSNKNDISIMLDVLSRNLKQISTSNNDLELVAKLRIFSSYYEFCDINEKYTIYSNYNQPLNENLLNLKFCIKQNDLIFRYEKNNFKSIHKCAFIDTYTKKEILEFDINVYSPIGLITSYQEPTQLPQSYVVANILDLDIINSFLKKSIGFVKVSTIEELKVKVASFSNSLLNDTLLKTPLKNEVKFKLIPLS